MRVSLLSALLISLSFPTLAYAQNPPPDAPPQGADPDHDGADEDVTHKSTEGEPLPVPESDNDVAPPVAQPMIPAGGVVEQAGIGGPTGYGRAGVLELGGSAGFTAASDLTQVSFTPSIGWFAADNLELSALMGFTYIETGDQNSTYTSLQAEPSYHLPFNEKTFGFLGLGLGASYLKGPGMAFAMTPRLGANMMVGRSGVLTPAIAWSYNTYDSQDTSNGMLLTVGSSVVANIGYTVMW